MQAGPGRLVPLPPLPPPLGELLVEHRRDGLRRSTQRDVVQELRAAGSSWPPISSLSSACLMNGITRVSQATSEAVNACIWPAMLLDRGVGRLALVAERGRISCGDLVEPVAAPLERDQQRLLGAAHVVRDVELLRPARALLGLHAVARDLVCRSCGESPAPSVSSCEERRADLARGLVADAETWRL